MSYSKILLETLLESARILGVPEIDLHNATDLLLNREYGLAYDLIITQLYENEIEIDTEFLDLVKESALQLNINPADYSFMQDLVRTEKVIPRPVKAKLAEILKTLNK